MTPPKPAKAKRKPDGPAPCPESIAGMTLDLELPPRMSTRLAISSCANDRRLTSNNQTTTLICAAAVLLCWPKAQRKPGCPQYHHDLMAYGSDALDYLIAQGIEAGIPPSGTQIAISHAGPHAVRLVTDALVTAEDLVKARDFSEPDPDDSSEEDGE